MVGGGGGIEKSDMQLSLELGLFSQLQSLLWLISGHPDLPVESEPADPCTASKRERRQESDGSDRMSSVEREEWCCALRETTLLVSDGCFSDCNTLGRK